MVAERMKQPFIENEALCSSDRFDAGLHVTKLHHKSAALLPKVIFEAELNLN